MPLQAIDQRLRQLQLRTHRPVEHLLAGEYRSVFKGRGMDFDEIRAYHPGDEVRSIDWNVTARTGRPYVKRYVEERELVVWLLVDASASCRVTAPGRSKWDVLNELAALLTLAATYNQDRVGMLVWSDGVEQILQPRKGRQHALRLLTDLLSLQPRQRGSDPGPALDALLHMAQRPVLVLLLSDFLFDMDRDQLGAVAFRHDLVACAVNHPSEISPPACGLAAVQDAETGQVLVADFGVTGQNTCQRTFQEQRARLRSGFATGAPICWNWTRRATVPMSWPVFFATDFGGPLMKQVVRPLCSVRKLARTWRGTRRAAANATVAVLLLMCFGAAAARAGDRRELQCTPQSLQGLPGEPIRVRLTVALPAAKTIDWRIPAHPLLKVRAVEKLPVRRTRQGSVIYERVVLWQGLEPGTVRLKNLAIQIDRQKLTFPAITITIRDPAR